MSAMKKNKTCTQHMFAARGKTVLFLCLLLASALALGGCSTLKGMFSNVTVGEEEEVERNMPPETRIREGMDAYDVGRYSEAIKSFTALLLEHPFSPQAMLAELKLADAYYYDGQYDEAKVHYREFENKHPTNEAIPYVLFQYGMCDYARADRIDRDPNSMSQAIKSFTRLLNAYPNSAYSPEATSKIKEAREYLANHEYLVAVFYVRTEKHEAAKQRLNYLLSTYPESDLAPKAKELLNKLEAGDAPSLGLRKWLPDFMVSDKEPNPSQELKTEPSLPGTPDSGQ